MQCSKTMTDSSCCWAKAVMFVLCLVDVCYGNLNLYLTQSEVRRLLGLQAELFYVREGVINEYALNFVVPVPAHISDLHFTWQSLAGRPLPYLIAVDVPTNDALGAPRLNVSTEGSVPTTTQTFRVALPCSGLKDAEVNVSLSVNITLHRATNNVTALLFRRRKICLKDNGFGGMSQVVVVDPPQVEISSGSIFYIAVGCACALITVIIIVVTAYYVRNNKTRRQGEMLQESRNGSSSSAHGHATFLTAETPLPNNNFTGTSASSCKSGASYASFKRLPSYTVLDDRAGKDIHERIAELTIQRCRVRLRTVVLEGTFGRVYHGTYTEEEGVEEDVLVKTVTDHASQVQVSLLLQEGMTMYGLSHSNVLSVLGVSIEDHTAPFLIYPHRGDTNLKRFLQTCKLSAEGMTRVLTTQEVVAMALQVVHAMQFLHKKRLLHRDLATRNCVVDQQLKVQVADNALSRDLFPADYHCLGDNENRPVKWLAIESLVHGNFSAASDVWSFGVLLWELTTLAQQPYVEVDPFEMAAYLRDGYRLAQPVNCPDELFAVMAYCWAMSVDERPTFTQLHVCLQEFYTQLTRYV
ncbi:tyrosine-protein kinase Dnt [Zootermopsis nevadensis]|uniref:tyrosine-protein kinase Dnt n=1 Tax=Zootermopsis nevadensis TaxID=136037 RepID=UPI000B8E7BA3|nr:tyrosine-protein kinase Dnt [Zootermopsis nevadensis]